MSNVAAAKPPNCPRVASDRINTPGSPWCSCMRMRSPRMAPRVQALLGSTARMPTVLFWLRKTRAKAAANVLFPAPGGPVSPISGFCPAKGKAVFISSRPGCVPFSIQVAARAKARRSPCRICSHSFPAEFNFVPPLRDPYNFIFLYFHSLA
jgi:hypothetical protein